MIEANSVIKSRSCYKLIFNSDLEFCEEYYTKISGLINLDKDKDVTHNFSIAKLELTNHDSAIKASYDTLFEEYKYATFDLWKHSEFSCKILPRK